MGMAPRCTGMCGALTTRSPSAVNSAQLKSNRSFTLTLLAVFQAGERHRGVATTTAAVLVGRQLLLLIGERRTVLSLTPKSHQQSSVEDGQSGERQKKAEHEIDEGLIDDEVDRVATDRCVNEFALVARLAKIQFDLDVFFEIRWYVVEDGEDDDGD